jgi:hypothetical protein
MLVMIVQTYFSRWWVRSSQSDNQDVVLPVALIDFVLVWVEAWVVAETVGPFLAVENVVEKLVVSVLEYCADNTVSIAWLACKCALEAPCVTCPSDVASLGLSSVEEFWDNWNWEGNAEEVWDNVHTTGWKTD